MQRKGKNKVVFTVGIFALVLVLSILIVVKKTRSLYDINSDGKLGISDITQISLKIGQSCENCPEDINKDGQINEVDLKILNEKLN